MLIAIPSARRFDQLLCLWSACWGDRGALCFPCKIAEAKKNTLRLGMSLANMVKQLQMHKER